MFVWPDWRYQRYQRYKEDTFLSGVFFCGLFFTTYLPRFIALKYVLRQNGLNLLCPSPL